MREEMKKQFLELMLAACAVYDRKPMEKPALQMYWNILSRFEFDQVKDAMARHMEASEWFPKPADLLRQINGEAGENASNVWVAIIRNLEAGNYDTGGYDVRALQALTAIGGIKELGRTDYSVLDFKRKAFIEAYEAADGAVNRGDLLLERNHDGKQLTAGALKLVAGQ